MKILVACEMSGVVREAFAALGHDAWSCDLLPSERPGNHIQGDVLQVLDQGWNMAVCFPPCDYLTVSGNRWFSSHAKAGAGILTGENRYAAQAKAIEFVKALWSAPIPKLAIENPIGRLSTLWQKPSQIVEPFYFGDPFKKSTCLWLRGLPKLTPTNNLGSGKQACWTMAPSATRKQDRSRTPRGFALAMSQQWT